MSTEPDYVWSRNDEDYRHNELSDLINYEELQAGDVVYRGIMKGYEPSRFVPDASWIVEQMNEQACDVGGEWAESWPEPSDEACAELDSLLKDWANKNCGPCTFYTVEKTEPYTITEDDMK